MIFTETSLQGVFLVDLEPVRDERENVYEDLVSTGVRGSWTSITWVQSSFR